MAWNDPHQPVPIKGCNTDTIFDMAHYYDCRPYQHDKYTFTSTETQQSTTQEAMHALLPLRGILGDTAYTEQVNYCLEESVHALLHGDLFRARLLARPLNITIDPHHH